VAEQNMVSVAAGLARNGWRPWVYSIAPFAYARPFEQVRNDVCLHGLPVVIVGNGGGYGYGVMGATHHALEDYGTLLCLPNLRAYVPAFDSDVAVLATHLFAIDHPAYLRLGVAETPKGFTPPPFAPWRKLLRGRGVTLVVVGPLVGGILEAVRQLGEERPDVWLVSELPLTPLPEAFLADLARSQRLVVVEEHVAQGGAGAMLASALLAAGRAPRQFTHRAARGYVSGLYGSQKFHRAECGLDPAAVAQLVRQEVPG
jgi:transketolase